MENEVKSEKVKKVRGIPEGFMTPAMIAEKYGKTPLAVRIKLRKTCAKREDGWLISVKEAEDLFAPKATEDQAE